MFSHPPISASIVLQNASLSFESYAAQYVDDDDFKDIYAKMTHGSQVDNYHLQGKFLYHRGKLCISTNERIDAIREAHTSLVSGNFGVGKKLVICRGCVNGLT